MQEASQKTTTSKRLRKKFKDTAHMPPWMQDRMEQLLQKEIHDTEVKVSELVKAQDLSTGHAFIIFNEEAKRNEFIKRVKKPLPLDGAVCKAPPSTKKKDSIRASLQADLRGTMRGEYPALDAAQE